MRAVSQQKQRLGYGPQPSPERHVYIKAAREHRPTRHAMRLSVDEVRQIRAMFQSGAVLYTIAAHFSIPRGEAGRIARRPFKLRSEVPAPFETDSDRRERELWLDEEIAMAWCKAEEIQAERDWSEAKREDKRRVREAKS